LNAVAFEESVDPKEVCYKLFEKRLFAKPTRNNALRFTPPLCISNQQMSNAIEIIYSVLSKL
ncbi:hypothetical protein, partial [Pseudomonas aeruginosa]|uniref:hypothetical protein n=1 Tax=Pseudomonas aeruginosa TaxID=287 RepID=UPI002B404D95